MRTSDHGYVVVWMLVCLSLLTAAFTSIEFTVESRPIDPTAVSVFGVTLLLSALGLFIEAKRDLYAVSMFSTVVAFLTAIITGSVALLGDGPRPVAVTVAIVATATLAACVVYLIRTQYGREVLPNLLRKQFHATAIHEVDGIQFVTTCAPDEICAGDDFQIRVFVQNGWSAPRTFTFGLETETRLSLNKSGLHHVSAPRVVLSAGAMAVLTIPVVAHARAKGRYALVAKPVVTGSGGTRVRRWRGKAPGRRIPWWFTAITPLLGFIAWGGGIRFTIRVQEGTRAVVPVRVPEPISEILWSPEPELLEAAVRAAA